MPIDSSGFLQVQHVIITRQDWQSDIKTPLMSKDVQLSNYDHKNILAHTE